jgi:DMSO/TMAO reductase YedYZ molybdopterin-dependent catalytic subunit
MGEGEPTLPPGQVWGKKFVIYAALGVPKVDPSMWSLKLDGLVEKPLEFSYQQLLSMPQLAYAKPFFCVTRWSIKDASWEGVSIPALAKQASVKPEADWVMFHCVDGYTAPVPLEDAMRDDSMVALRLNGKPLSREQGFPARPFMPHLYGWKSAKWVNRIEFISGYSDGYWEMYGYHERADVFQEERFKGGSGKQARKTAVGTA